MNPMMAAQRRRRSVTYSDEELPKLAVDEISLDEEPADEAEGAAISCASLATKDVWLERGAAPAWAGTCCGGLSEGQPKVNQDACVVKTDVLGVPGQHLLAVFDGHGTHGEHFSRLAAQRVVAELRAAAAGVSDLSTLEPAARKRVFQTVVARLEAGAMADDVQEKYGAKSGTTLAAACVLADGSVVAVAVGDSPVSLRTERKSWRSRPHDAESGRAAVEAAGGFVRDGRVWADDGGPGLAMTRSLGDALGKRVGVSAAPDVCEVALADFAPPGELGDVAVVVCSDGVSDAMPLDEVHDRVDDARGDADRLRDVVAAIHAESEKRWWADRDDDEYVDDMSVVALVVRNVRGSRPTPTSKRRFTAHGGFEAVEEPPRPALERSESMEKRADLRRHVLAVAACVAREVRALPDVWASHALELRPAEVVLRHRYDAAARTWSRDPSLVKVDGRVFDEGAMRRCYRAKKLNFGYVQRYHALEWRRVPNFVLKEYKKPADDGDDRRAFDDVETQTEAALWADRFNALRPPKPIKMIACCVLEFQRRPGSPKFCAERFIDGTDARGFGFVKHNSNSGYVDDSERRLTPQAFSAFSFYASEGDVLVCDVQGVGDLYTDPQLHSSDESRGDGDLGRRGMALFFASLDSRRNGLFDALGIPHFDLSAVERHRAAEASKRVGSDSEETSPRTKQKIHRTHRSSVVRFAGLEAKTRMSCHDDARRRRPAWKATAGSGRPDQTLKCSSSVGHKRLYLGATAPGEASPLRGHRHVAWALTLKSGFANFAGLGACRFVYEAVAATLRAAGAAVGPGLRLLPDPIAVTASPEYDALAYGGDVHYSGIVYGHDFSRAPRRNRPPGGPRRTSRLASSVASTSIRPMSGRVVLSRRVREGRPKRLIPTVRRRARRRRDSRAGRMRFEVKRTSIGDGFRGADGVAQILPGTQVPPGTTLRPPGPNVVFEGLLDRPGTAWAGNIAAPCAPDAAPRRKASGDRDPDWGSRPSRGDTLE
ncbi:alpha-kinase [Aureococcus anophagefferens]|uniref:Alpha-kinase n=2 Tax=Aureococcus anophagefferens TaxID=44056 RepID=A0ABR1FZM5_AURAN